MALLLEATILKLPELFIFYIRPDHQCNGGACAGTASEGQELGGGVEGYVASEQ